MVSSPPMAPSCYGRKKEFRSCCRCVCTVFFLRLLALLIPWPDSQRQQRKYAEKISKICISSVLFSLCMTGHPLSLKSARHGHQFKAQVRCCQRSSSMANPFGGLVKHLDAFMAITNKATVWQTASIRVRVRVLRVL